MNDDGTVNSSKRNFLYTFSLTELVCFSISDNLNEYFLYDPLTACH